MSEDQTTVNVKGLDQILKGLKGKMPTAKVGILGGNARSDGLSNADVGAAHEFGTSKLPMRSFLRIPIADNLDKRMQQANLMSEEVLKAVIKDGSVLPWIKQVAVIAENIVLDAFDTGGFGKWAPWGTSPSIIKRVGRSIGLIKQARPYSNNTGMILVDTQQLRNSITYEVSE